MIPCVFFQSNRKAGIRLESNSIKSSEVRWGVIPKLGNEGPECTPDPHTR